MGGFISPTDLNLFQYAETAQEVWDLIMRSMERPPLPARCSWCTAKTNNIAHAIQADLPKAVVSVLPIGTAYEL